MTTVKYNSTWKPLAELAQRVIGGAAEHITFTQLEGPGRRFLYFASKGHLVIQATDPSSAAVGLHDYLRKYCGIAVSWDDQRPPAPDRLPDAPATETAARVKETYYLNFCTFGYTTAWWGWEEWEREIDWMALRGVTMPLMMVGHEAVLEKVFLDEGVDQSIVNKFLSGPAYLPWFAMGNLDGFAGPLPSGWIPAHKDLAGRILRRQRELGMRPILPAFTGHVPPALARSEDGRDWQGHRTHVVKPEDPLFRRLAGAIARAQKEFWGTDHLYAADPFIEMIPVEDDPEYPGRVAEALLLGLTDVDPSAVWFLQTWAFSYQSDFWTEARVRTFLEAIPKERLVLLDLWAEAEPQWRRFPGFSGRDWIWCALLNFGGRNDPLADLPGLDHAMGEAFTSPHPPVGVGLSMEATRSTPVYYERVLDLAWEGAGPLPEWLRGWVVQRYRLPAGAPRERAVSAWQLLSQTVLASGNYRIFPESFTGLMTQRPSTDLYTDTSWLRKDVAELFWYDPALLIEAWRSLVEVAETAPDGAAGPLGRDLVEVALAVLPRCAELNFLAAYATDGFVEQESETQFFNVFDDLENLLATRPEFRYDVWEEDALSWAVGPGDREILTSNARRLLTVWGDPGDGHLDDYSARLWAGLVSYYRGRWHSWAELHPSRVDSPEQLEEALCQQEQSFLRDGTTTPTAGEDVVTVSRRLVDRYAEVFLRQVDRFKSTSVTSVRK